VRDLLPTEPTQALHHILLRPSASAEGIPADTDHQPIVIPWLFMNKVGWQTRASLVMHQPEMVSEGVMSLRRLNFGLEDVSLLLTVLDVCECFVRPFR